MLPVKTKDYAKILDAYVKDSRLESVALATNLSREQINEALTDPVFVQQAVQRKVSDFAVWWVGEGLDELRTVMRGDNVKDKLRAVDLSIKFIQMFVPQNVHHTGTPAVETAIKGLGG